MLKKLFDMFFCMLLIADAVPTVVTENLTEMEKLFVLDGSEYVKSAETRDGGA